MKKTALILGASGKVGRHSALAFESASWQVKLFDRQGSDMDTAAQGVDVIVNGLNPPNYHQWGSIIPRITEQVIQAAQSSGATVILPGNVYHFGDSPGIWSERTTPAPISRKGEIRLAMEKTYQSSGVQTIVLRAGNFIDPDRCGCVMSTVYLRQIHRRKLTVPGDDTVKQAFCYLPDWARAAAELAQMRGSLATFEDVPFPNLSISAKELKLALEKAHGHRIDSVGFPWWLMKATAPFWELARELNEMRYLWNTDHTLCSQRLDALLPDFKHSNLQQALKPTHIND